ncbi:MAG TPA: chaperone modulator CbpM [Paucimonas sp.]|nr:chaperone modulator CbpM [Paucimonas sp.]
MTREHVAVLLDETRLTLEELAASCAVSREWVIEHVRAGVLLAEPDPDPGRWHFNSRDVWRLRKMSDLERHFDANPELAGLVADLFEEVERLRIRLRRAGLHPD